DNEFTWLDVISAAEAKRILGQVPSEVPVEDEDFEPSDDTADDVLDPDENGYTIFEPIEAVNGHGRSQTEFPYEGGVEQLVKDLAEHHSEGYLLIFREWYAGESHDLIAEHFNLSVEEVGQVMQEIFDTIRQLIEAQQNGIESEETDGTNASILGPMAAGVGVYAGGRMNAAAERRTRKALKEGELLKFNSLSSAALPGPVDIMARGLLNDEAVRIFVPHILLSGRAPPVLWFESRRYFVVSAVLDGQIIVPLSLLEHSLLVKFLRFEMANLISGEEDPSEGAALAESAWRTMPAKGSGFFNGGMNASVLTPNPQLVSVSSFHLALKPHAATFFLVQGILDRLFEYGKFSL
ncbi:MAG TPA: hypothetical protein P5246_08650, partial [Candidatus Omnitrophota bacterium]|nr:hypothetical protein [Candidatus Omnitrophota bacterium]